MTKKQLYVDNPAKKIGKSSLDTFSGGIPNECKYRKF